MPKTAAARYRLLISRIFLLIIIVVLLFSDNKVSDWSPTYNWLEFFGYLFGLIGVFGRIWSSLFIEGNKTQKLIVKGPYSLMRNPLYFFSFILLMGLCFFIKSILVFSVFFLLWIFIYRNTMLSEEKNLTSNHNKEYMNYYNRTPKIFPNFNIYRSFDLNEKMNIDIKKIERVLTESFGFLFLFGIIKVIEYLHLNDILPVYFELM